MSVQTADVIIIGSGIVGNSAAYYLRRKGRSVIVLDENMIGHGGSSRNGGGVRQSGRDSRELPLAMYAVKNIWPYMKEELGIDPEYMQDGYLVCGYDEKHEKDIEKRIEVATAAGLEMCMLKGKDIQEVNPYVSDHVVCAGWTPSDGSANPMRATLAFYINARRLGAKYYTHERVEKLKVIKGRVRRVITKKGNIYEGDQIIVAAGYGGRDLLKSVGLDVPLYPRLVDVIVTEAAKPMFTHMIGGMSGFYGHQTEHGSFVFGNSSGREASFGCYADKLYSTAYNPSFICNTVGVDIPALKELKVIRTWSGWIDMCVDGVPVIGKVQDLPGILVDIGSTGHGFCPGPAVGKVLAELANEEEPCVDISRLAYERFDYASGGR